ncbi:dymeclin-like isoform X1 [Bolinopsis microptera]|uniref:dymeclin-like isoform X1 n=1 Tax=Bolinopsis microptera TaxID=2820187 RepID=UPI0030795AC2
MSTLLSIVTSLVKHALSLTTPQAREELETLYNSLLILRTLTKHLVQNEPLSTSYNHFLTPDIVAMQPQGEATDVDSSPTIALKHVARYETSVDELCFYLYEFLINYPVRLDTIQVHSECVKILTTLLSSPLYHTPCSSSSSPSTYLTDMMTGRCSSSAPQLIQTLITNSVHQPLPQVTTVASYLWSYVPFSGSDKPLYSDTQFFKECLLLVLLLTNHSSLSDNPYKRALCSFGHKEPSSNANETCFVMDLDLLYSYFCRDPEHTNEQDTLLLYTLIQGNVNVKAFLLSRTDVERMLMPMLHVVYEAEQHSTHHMYMVLIILLILTHDDHFSSYIHDQVLGSVSWYKERVLTNISTGGILILVILKTMQTNMTKMRDKYLHTNCLATLANMSSKFHSFHPYVAEKVLNLFTTIVKKYTKMRNSLLGVGGEITAPDSTVEYWESELETLEDIIRMFLEIFNSSICYSGKNNPVLLYELLHKRDIFIPFQTHPTFSELIINIESILGYLTTKLEEKTEEQGVSVSVNCVMEVIEEVVRQWPADRLQKTALLKFEYVEETRPEDFFLPYIWTLLFSNSNLYWDTSRITLKV